MKIRCDRNILQNAITPAMLAVTVKNTIVSLEGLLITADKTEQTLTICGYDLEKGVKVTIGGGNVYVEEEGGIIINAVKFSSVIRNLPDGDVIIATDENLSVMIRVNKSDFTLHGISVDMYPVIPVLKGNKVFKIKQSVLRNLINNTSFSAGQNNPKAVLNGIFFEITDGTVKAVAVDGFRLSYRYFENEIYINDQPAYDGSILQNFIFPKITASELCKILKDSDDLVEVGLTNKHLMVSVDNIIFFTRLIEGEYIDYKNVILNNTATTATINRKDFTDSIERAAVLMEDRNKSPVRLTFVNGENGAALRITNATSLGKVEDEVAVELEGNGLEIGYNHVYLLDALRHIEDEKIVLKLESPIKGMVILPQTEDGSDISSVDEALKLKYLYIVIPVRLRGE